MSRFEEQGKPVLRAFARICLLLSLAAASALLLQRVSHLLFHLPPKGVGVLPTGPKGKRISRKVVVIVVDGLSVAAARQMPHLNALSQKGAWLVARTGPLSYSRAGYAAIGSGASTTITGVTTNGRRGIAPLDSLFRRARAAGLLSALVGYGWWMDLFGPDIPIASVGSGRKRGDALFHAPLSSLPKKPLPKGFRRRVLHGGTYRRIKGSWRRYVRKHRLYDAFGDDPKTKQHEDRVRLAEALRLLQRERTSGSWVVPVRPIDLLFVHLHAPDEAGHRAGSPHTEGYRKACALVDEGIAEIATRLDWRRDTLLVTADHGFTRAIRDAGHGGWESSAAHVPLVMVGKGIKRRWMQGEGLHPARKGAATFVDQVDIAPTVAVLLGVPFPTLTEGAPLWEAMALPGLMAQRRKAHWYRAQAWLYRRLLGRTHEHGPKAGPALLRWWRSAQMAYRREQSSRLRWTLFLRICLGLFVLGCWAWCWYVVGGVPWRRGLWWGMGVWIVYQMLFVGGYIALFGSFSLSSIRSGSSGFVLILAVHLVVLSVVLCAAWMCLRLADVGRRWRRLTSIVYGCGVCVLGSVVVGFGVVGWGTGTSLPHGLLLFATMVAYVQAFAWSLCACLLGCWWPYRRG